MAYRRRKDNEDSESGLGNHSVPYQDANLELGEVPLDDIDTFVIPARDEKGSYSTVHINVPPHMYRQMQIVVKSGRFPYLDVSDFVRHACFRQLHFCISIRQSISKHVYTATEALLEVCRDNELRLRVAAAFEEIDRQITGHMNRLEISDAIRLLTILKNRVDAVPPSTRQVTLRAGILRRFGYVLEHNGEVRQMTEREKDQDSDAADNQVGQPEESVENVTGERGGKNGGYQ